MPEKIAPRRSPQASEPSMLRSEVSMADFTSPSVSIFSRASSRLLVAGLRLAESSLAASRRLALSLLAISTAARTRASWSLMAALVSAA